MRQESFYIFALQNDFLILVGLLGILKYYRADQRSVPTTSARVTLFEQVLDMCSMIDRKRKVDVEKVMAAISNFTYPWEIDNKDKLYFLTLGFPVSE